MKITDADLTTWIKQAENPLLSSRDYYDKLVLEELLEARQLLRWVFSKGNWPHPKIGKHLEQFDGGNGNS